MVLEAGFIISAYFGSRLVESEKKRQKIFGKYPRLPKKKSQKTKKCLESVEQETTADTERYLKISLAQVGLGAVKQFVYPPIAPVFYAAFLYSNYPLFRRTERSLKEGKVGNDFINTAANLSAVGLGQYFAAGVGTFAYFFGDKVIEKTKHNSQNLLLNSLDKLPTQVWVLKNNIESQIALDALEQNDVIIIQIGETIAVDGKVIDGFGMVDEHSLTGEFQAAEKNIGDNVYASTVLVRGKLYVKTEKTGAQTTVSRIDSILEQSSNFKSKTQLRGQHWADASALPFLGASALTSVFAGPLTGLVVLTASAGSLRTISPLVTFSHLKKAAHKGILVKDGRVFERIGEIDTILFDKTGTLTNNELKVKALTVTRGFEANKMLAYAAAAECRMSHPIAKAILQHAKALNLELPSIEDASYQVGFGICAHIEGHEIKVGSKRFIQKEGIYLDEAKQAQITKAHEEGLSSVIVSCDTKIMGIIFVEATIRPEVKTLIYKLKQQGIKHLGIVSGDHEYPTKKLARELGMHSFYYDVLPQDKACIVKTLQEQKRSVCFVGDGVNDVLAMNQADISISLAGASAVTTDLADVLLMDGSLSHIHNLLEASQELERHLNKSFKISMLPTGAILGGISIFQMGFATAVFTKTSMFVVGIANAVRPLAKIQKQEQKLQKEKQLLVNE